jgi:hypothetical protein
MIARRRAASNPPGSEVAKSMFMSTCVEGTSALSALFSGGEIRSRETMSNSTSSDAAKAVVRRNTEEVQGKGDFRVFEELFADDFADHSTQPGTSPDKAGVRKL